MSVLLTNQNNNQVYLSSNASSNNQSSSTSSRKSNQSLDEEWSNSTYFNNETSLSNQVLEEGEEVTLPSNFSDQLEDLISMPVIVDQGKVVKSYLPSPTTSPKLSTRKLSLNPPTQNLENNNDSNHFSKNYNEEAEELSPEAIKRSRRISTSLIPILTSSRLSYYDDSPSNTSISRSPSTSSSATNNQLEITSLPLYARSSSPIDRRGPTTKPRLIRGNSANSSLRDELVEELRSPSPSSSFSEGKKFRSTVRSVSESTSPVTDPAEWASFRRAPSRNGESGMSSIPRIRPISISLTSSSNLNSTRNFSIQPSGLNIRSQSPLPSSSSSPSPSDGVQQSIGIYGSPRLPSSSSSTSLSNLRKPSLAGLGVAGTESLIPLPKLRTSSISSTTSPSLSPSSPPLSNITTTTSPRIRAQTSNWKSSDLPRSVSAQNTSLRNPSNSSATMSTNLRPTSVYSTTSSNTGTARPTSIYANNGSRPPSIYSPTFSKPPSSLIPTSFSSPSSPIINTPSPSHSPTLSFSSITPRYSPIQSKARQRSFSTGRMLDESTGPEAPWVRDIPVVFREDGTGELARTGRMDQMVLPAVAKRLEAERLSISKLEDDILITAWEKDGTPRTSIVTLSSSTNKLESPPTSPPTEHEHELEVLSTSATLKKGNDFKTNSNQLNLTPPSTPIPENNLSTSSTSEEEEKNSSSSSDEVIPVTITSNSRIEPIRKYSVTPEIRIDRSNSIDVNSTLVPSNSTNLLPAFNPTTNNTNSNSSSNFPTSQSTSSLSSIRSETDSVLQRRLNPIFIRPKSMIFLDSSSPSSPSSVTSPPTIAPSIVSNSLSVRRESQEALEAEEKAVKATKNMVEKVGKVNPVNFKRLSYGVESSLTLKEEQGAEKVGEKVGENLAKGKKKVEEDSHGGGCSCSIM